MKPPAKNTFQTLERRVLRISTRVEMSLPVLRCRRFGSANGKPSQGYCFRLLRQRLLLINSRLRTAVRSSDSTPLCMTAVSTHRRGAKTSPSPLIWKKAEVKSCFLDTEPDIYSRVVPWNPMSVLPRRYQSGGGYQNPMFTHSTRRMHTSNISSTFLQGSHSTVLIRRVLWTGSLFRIRTITRIMLYSCTVSHTPRDPDSLKNLKTFGEEGGQLYLE